MTIKFFLHYLDDIQVDSKSEVAEVRLVDASFAWEEGKTVLHDLQFKYKGQLVAIVGYASYSLNVGFYFSLHQDFFSLLLAFSNCI